MGSIAQIWRSIDDAADSAWDIAKRIHQTPEQAFEERVAAGLLTDMLEQAGYEVSRGVGELPTAFRADHPANNCALGPTIALIAEYDALPDVGHACGHHLIAASSLGAALGLRDAFSDVSANLSFIGCPAEETGGGKIKLLDHGVFDDIDVAMMVHPGDETWSKRDYLALQECTVSFKGRAAHAVANAGAGINALDALIMMFQCIHAARASLPSDVWVNGIVSEGGTLPNTIPEIAVGRFQIRSSSNKEVVALLKKIDVIAEGCARATGALHEVTLVGQMYKTMLLNSQLANAYETYAVNLGFPCVTTPAGLASTDLGNVSWKLPVLHPHINVLGNETAALHSRQFAKKSISCESKAAMLAAAKCLAAIAYDIAVKDGFWASIVEEHRERKARECDGK